MSILAALAVSLVAANPTPTDLAGAGVGERLAIELAADRAIDATVLRRVVHEPGRVTISGRLDEGAGGTFTIALNDSAVAGVVRSRAHGAFRVRRLGNELAFAPVDLASLPDCEMTGAGAPPAGSPANPGQPCDDGSVVDVLVVFTTDALADAGGIPEMEALIDMAVEDTNVSLGNSDAEMTFNLVYTQLLTENPALLNLQSLTNPNDGIIDGVHTLRDAYGADEVVMISSGGGGVANGMWTFEPDQAANAFCIVGINSILNLVFAHELGHNLGCCHAFGDGGGCPAEGGLLFPFSNGHRFIGDSDVLWRTVMAYQPGERIYHFSDPAILFDGQSTGLVDGTEPAGANNAQTIREARIAVANWRCNDGICEALDLPADAPDCDGNGVPDACDIARGDASDENGNGIPDSCESDYDLNGDGMVDGADLGILLASWGDCPFGCDADFNGDGQVDGVDLGLLLGAWGDLG